MSSVPPPPSAGTQPVTRQPRQHPPTSQQKWTWQYPDRQSVASLHAQSLGFLGWQIMSAPSAAGG